MDQNKRQALEKRRQQLKQKLSQAEQLKDKAALLSALDTQKIAYEIYWDGDRTAHKALEKFPITSYGVLDLIKMRDTLELAWEWENEAELPKKLEKLVKEKGLGNPDVFVVYSTEPTLDLKTSLSAVVKNAKEAYGNSVDVFIVCPQNNWAIEIYHEDKIYFGRIR
ncbi:hypothetical protein COT42_01115 [Candidatus Saganbacteria bacterium CG08_land_8_20_14_0_20_45_16]|uniref:Uncharacterized protein n=1 Tax=Candidatus Saganbacteria bacterium CG08_land_8_20_14_0_20_45_16 TaxID=2014293 RepID=A0A2H0Y1E4_UNCSA|nr:MAG: hypothetical protein COT42_01115 [Candidatus Saganbacteria bacterium CG08_land_8_20_14_0_20_45_16]